MTERGFGLICAINLDPFKYTNTYCPFGRYTTAQMVSLTPCIWTIQIYVTGPSIWTTQERKFEWSKYTISIDSESPLVWTVQLDERLNKRPYTVNLDVQTTPFGLCSLYVDLYPRGPATSVATPSSFVIGRLWIANLVDKTNTKRQFSCILQSCMRYVAIWHNQKWNGVAELNWTKFNWRDWI